jgi:hypothetical protein
MAERGARVGRSRDDTINDLEFFLRGYEEKKLPLEEPGFFRQIGQETMDYWGDFWKNLFGSRRRVRPGGTEEFDGESVGLRRQREQGRDYDVLPEWGEENIRLIDSIMSED